MFEMVEINEKRRGAAIMVQQGDRFLVCKRIGCRDMNGLLQFPGGCIEDGETPIQAACRELTEETGLSTFYLPKFLSTIAFWVEGNLFVTSVFHSQYLDVPKIVNAEPDKHGDWMWLTISQIAKHDHIPIIPFYAYKYGDLPK